MELQQCAFILEQGIVTNRNFLKFRKIKIVLKKPYSL
jgi:hypothetical protein